MAQTEEDVLGGGGKHSLHFLPTPGVNPNDISGASLFNMSEENLMLPYLLGSANDAHNASISSSSSFDNGNGSGGGGGGGQAPGSGVRTTSAGAGFDSSETMMMRLSPIHLPAIFSG